ncbi:MAG: homocysteine S-methyltransferase family protein, partial [Geobacteraceae bacterium]|nr:homocysteine S-methyltransferase family protein [Geobacteraceae bacterium]
MKPFLDAIKEKVLVLDGAMGTMLQERGLKPGQSPEELNLTMPEVVASVHRDYIDAGADIIITNTFGGTHFKLSHYGLEGRLAEINASAVAIARREAAGKAYVGASIGPTGQFVEPLGEVAFDVMKSAFREQASALVEAGADLISLETFLDIKECRAAVIGIREISSTIPIIAMLTFDDNGRSVLGTPPESAAITLTAAGADIVGSNCGLGVDGIYDILCRMRGVTALPLISQANAGLPQLIGDKTVFPGTPAEMTAYHERMLDMGVRIIGGCCGTTPDHIRAMKLALSDIQRGWEPPESSRGATLLSSRSGWTSLGAGAK